MPDDNDPETEEAVPPAAGDEIGPEVRRVQEIIDTVLEEVGAMPPRKAYEISTALHQYLESKAKNATFLTRATAVRDIRDSEAMSFNDVAEALGMSKPRAAQLIRAAVAHAKAAD